MRRLATERDLLLFSVAPERVLAIATDSSGGVGPKRGDSVNVSGKVLGRYASRTVLLELVCAGAHAVALAVSMGVEYRPTGKRILSGCGASLAEIGSSAPVIWSSEKNFAVDTTGLGVTAIGLGRRRSVKIGCSRKEDLVVLLGRPSVGKAVLVAERRKMIPSITQTVKLTTNPLVHEVIPVGSTGVLHEAGVLARDSGLRFEPSVPENRLRVSAGPSTALLLTLPQAYLSRIENQTDLPLLVIGSLRRPTKALPATSKTWNQVASSSTMGNGQAPRRPR